jgi:hypothetical protein
MKVLSARKITNALISITLLGTVCGASAADKIHTPPVPATASNIDHVKNAASMEIAKHRKTLVKEAVIANDEILHAIFNLEKKDTKRAFDMLGKADGQLNILLARAPKLKLAPIDVRASITDIDVSPEKIQKAVKDAKDALDDGHIQTARTLLAPLASEMHIDTDYLPLETYPDAIKIASREIQASKLEDAEATLADALSSIVTSEEVIPLPPLKAQGDILKAEKLQKQGKDKQAVLSMLDNADQELADAKALGYGSYQQLRKEIASIKNKVDGGSKETDLFEHLKKRFEDILHIKN